MAVDAAQASVTTLLTTPSAASFGYPVQLRAVIQPGSATGTVSFFDGSIALATVAVDASGQASITLSTLAIGPHALTASYSGNDAIQPSISAAVQFAVSRPAVQMVSQFEVAPDTAPGAQSLTEVNGTLFFRGFDPVNGDELWRSDGTAEGTVLVRDIVPGIGGCSPQILTNVNGTLFFVADDGVNGSELWKSNGTAAGTVMVKDIVPGLAGSYPYNLANINGTLYFTTRDGSTAIDLWKSDGTAEGTVMLKAFATNYNVSVSSLTEVNGTVFFMGGEPATGMEIWKSDGTSEGTVLVKDIYPGYDSANPMNLTSLNGMLYFVARNGTYYRFWKTDGTSEGTVVVKDNLDVGYGTSIYPNLINVNGTLFFTTYSEFSGYQLWKSDGTGDGTVMVVDFKAMGVTSVSRFTELNGTLFFAGFNSASGLELWKSDGTAAGTVQVKDINPGTFGSMLDKLTNVNGTLYFSAQGPAAGGVELWKSDGTADGTVLVKDIYIDSSSTKPDSSPDYLTNINGTLFFTAKHAVAGIELWRSDGTDSGTVLVKDVNTMAVGPSVGDPVSINGRLLFAASDPAHGSEIWKSNGTVAGTVLLRDIYQGTNSSSPRDLTVFKGKLYFTISGEPFPEYPPYSYRRMWATDGVTAGQIDGNNPSAPTIISDSLYFTDINGLWRIDDPSIAARQITPGTGTFTSPGNMIDVNGTLFFSASSSSGRACLWKSDGSNEGTVLVKEIAANTSGRIANLINVNGVLFFLGNDGSHGNELWRSDGTAAGTFMVKDIWPGTNNSGLPSGQLTAANVNGTLVFVAYDGTHGIELWKSDGTAAGTVLIKDVYPGVGSGLDAAPLWIQLGGAVLFTASDGAHGRELWKTDGTADGTVMLQDINPGPANGLDSKSPWTIVGGTLFIQANDGEHGVELWKTDGTSDGTVLVKDINAGSNGSSPSNFLTIAGTTFFSAWDGVHGNELWQTDGTTAGTFLVQDIDPDGSSSPSGLVNLDGTLFFKATTPLYGTELWKLVVPNVRADSYTVTAGQGLSVPAPGVLANDRDPSGGGLSAVLVAGAAHGTLSLNPDGSFTYTPEPGYAGPDSFTYRAVDESGRSTLGTVNLIGAIPGTAVTLLGTPSAPSFGQAVLLRATVYPLSGPNRITGTVTFRDGSTVLGAVSVDASGQASLSISNLAVGAHSIAAEFSGEGLMGSVSAPLDVPVRRAVVQPIMDVSYLPQSSGIRYLASINGTAFFFANDGVSGNELWKSDGTAAGTVLVKDINPGVGNGLAWNTNPYFTDISGTLFFVADDGTHGYELWKSNGTAAGTIMVKDIYPGPSSGVSYGYSIVFVNVNGTLFFTGNDGDHGIELWKSDGTEEGTVLVKDILPGSGYSVPSPMANVNGTLFFGAYDGVGSGLWKSDGTAEGTVMVTSAYPERLTNLNGTLYFRGADPDHGAELWRSDGTAEGTVLVKDINPGTASGLGSDPLIKANGRLFFTAYDPVNGSELWTSDGTADGTLVLKDIVPGSTGSYPSFLTDINGTLFFTLNLFRNTELWKTDGTPEGTVLVKQIYPSDSSYRVLSLANVDGTLFFAAAPSSSDHSNFVGIELWKSDGTAEGTALVKDMIPEGEDKLGSYSTIGDFFPLSLNGSLLFTMNGQTTGNELWRSDGTADGTALVKDINPAKTGSGPVALTAVGNTLFFVMTDGVHGAELWKSDGTSGGAALVADIVPGINSSMPQNLVNINGTLFFTADDSVHGRELWRSDGTAAGTFMVTDLNPGSATSSPANLTNVNGTLFFIATNGINGTELWKSDGTAEGTVLVKDTLPGKGSGLVPSAFLTNAGGTLFFLANDGVKGVELWKSDGTPAGTVLVKDIWAGNASSQPSNLCSVGATLFFTAIDGTNYSLWKSDGTEAGTVLLKNLYPGSSLSPMSIANVGGTLFFAGDDGSIGRELWKSDGTAAGTVLVKDVCAGAIGSNPAKLVNIGGTLFFVASDSSRGAEMWKSDGTAAGTVLVKDIYPGATSGIAADNWFPAGFNGMVYFAATNATDGRELWKSDGTPAGTVMVSNISASGSSSPGLMTSINGRLLFTADDGQHGRSLWSLVLPIAASDEYRVLVGETLTVSGPGVLGNDSDPGGGSLAASLVAGPAHGTLTFDSDGAFRYVPQANYTGADSFVYEAVDVDGGRTRSTVSLSVMAPVSVYGSAGDDMFYVRLDLTHTLLQVWQNAPIWGQSTYTWPVAGISTLSFAGLDGNDQLTIDCSSGSAIPAMGMAFDGGNGADMLRITGTSASDVLSVDSAGLVLNSKPVGFSDVEQEVLGGPPDMSVRLAGLSIGGSVQLRLDTGGDVGELSIADGASLDMGENYLIVRHPAGDHGAAKVEELRKLLRAALIGGGEENPWTGAGLTSTAARDNANMDTAIAVFNNDDGEGGAWIDNYHGVSVDQNSIILKYTYFGDANADGTITGDDFAAATTGWFDQMSGIAPTWMSGDFDYDGKVTADDFALVTASWFSQDRAHPLAAADGIRTPLATRVAAGGSCRPAEADPTPTSMLAPALITLADGGSVMAGGLVGVAKRELNVLLVDDLAVLA